MHIRYFINERAYTRQWMQFNVGVNLANGTIH